MNRLRSITRKATDDELENVENMLEDVLAPVLPRQAYVKDLNRRLSRIPDVPELEVSPNLPSVSGKPLISLVWSILGLLSGLVMVLVGIRVIVILVSGLRTIYQKQV